MNTTITQRLTKGFSVAYFDGSNHIFQTVEKTKHFPLSVDEKALNSAHTSIEAKKEELSALETQRAVITEKLTTAKEEYKRLLVQKELGEANVQQVNQAAKDLAVLDDTLRKLTESSETLISAMEAKQGAIEELKRRKHEALVNERERVYKEESDKCRTMLQTLLTKALELDKLTLSVGEQFRSLSSNGLAKSYMSTVPCFANIMQIHFHEAERELYGIRNTTPLVTREEEEKRREQERKQRGQYQ
ncbi:MAG: hypothetical protein ACOVSW_17975 [Candidatus Kapaibacteriota bacterium]|jgi:hypothetical protein